jgi:hypothetical protein
MLITRRVTSGEKTDNVMLFSIDMFVHAFAGLLIMLGPEDSEHYADKIESYVNNLTGIKNGSHKDCRYHAIN